MKRNRAVSRIIFTFYVLLLIIAFITACKATTSGSSVDSVSIKEGSASTGADPGASMTKAYGESLSFNAVVADSSDEGIVWTTSNSAVATISPSGTDNKQVSVTIVNSSGTATITAASQADSSKTDFLTITAEKKSISSIAMTYTALTVDEGDTTANTAAAALGNFLVGNDDLADAVTFSIEKKSGTGPEPGTDVSIDPATGDVTINPAQTAFTATTYTVTMTGKNHYKDSKTADITLTVNAGTSGDSVDSVTIKEGSASAGADPGASMTKAYGESLSFNAVVAVSGSPDEGIIWTTSNSAVATVSPSGTDNKQVSVTIVNSSGDATITAASQADSSKTDFLTITAEKKSISSIAMTYTALTIDEGDTTANTALAALGDFLVGNDDLADAVTFSIARKTGTGPEPGTDISIDPATGTITIAPAQTAFTATTYTVTMTGKNHYKDSKDADITLTVNVVPSVDSVSIRERSTSAGADPGESMTKAYGESLDFNAVVAVTGSPDEGISWTTSDNAVATISPSGTDNKQVSVTVVNSSGDATITAASQTDSSKTDSLTITAEKKSILSAAMTYTALTIDEGDATGNTVAAALGNFLVGNDNLADAVTFSIEKKSGTGPEPGTDVSIDPATGTITIAPAQTAFTATTYTVTMTGKNHYKDSKDADITLTVNVVPSVDSVSIKEGLTSTGADPGESMTKAYGESLFFNAVVDVTGSPDEGISWTTSNSAVATVSPSGTDNKQVSVTVVNSSGDATITAASQTDSSKTDSLTITAERKSISSAAMTYTNLTIDEGDATGNTAAAALGNFLVGNDDLADAVTFSIAKKSGTGPEPGTDVSIDPATGDVTINPAQTAFPATTYTVTMLGKNHYKDSKTADITLTVNVVTSVDSVSIKEGSTSAGADPGESMTKAYGESLDFNAVVAVTGSPDEGISWTTSDSAVATVSPSGTDNKQVNVTVVDSSGTATITAASQTDSSKTDSLTITAERKSISSAAMTYTNLTVDEGDATGNTAAAVIDQFLVGNDDLADAVTFSIARKSGTGPEPGTDISIDSATGTITINPAQTAFTATTYTVTMTGKNHYKDSKTTDITLTVNVVPAVDSVSIKEGLHETGGDPGASMTEAYGEVLNFNVVVAVTGSPDEGIIWTSSDSTVATVSPDGTDNKQVSVTMVNSIGDATITAASRADSSKTDSFTITAEKKSISSVAMTYTNLTIYEGAATGNTAAAAINQFLVGSDDLADAVTFGIARKSGTGPEPGTDISIDSATGTITIAPAQTAFTATIYTVTMTGKDHYKDSKTADITLTVNAISTADYGTPASISASTNTGTQLALSWDEFDSDTDTIYTVYAYNLTIRTSGGTAPTLEEFLRDKDGVADVTAIMSEVSAVTQWTDLTDPSTSASQLSDLRLHPGHKYVFVVTGTRGGNLDTDTMAAAVIDISGSAPAVYGTPTSGGNSFPVVLIAGTGGVDWKTAAHYSRAQGGGASLVEIGSQEEQFAVSTAAARASTEITKPASDGGGARYLWIGATDETIEGIWVWNGDDDDTETTPLGRGTGSNWAEMAYQNWGFGSLSNRQMEPDDSGGQDFAAIGVEGWPVSNPGVFGSRYQWNDISGQNMLSGYVMEVAQDW